MKILAILQARMGSARLPGKVLSDLGGKPMLLRVWDRIARIRGLDGAFVATTDSESDDAVEDLCHIHRLPVFRGSVDDVLDRFYQCAHREKADAVMRLTADCPLLDPEVSTRVLREFLASSCDYASNTLVPTYPDGLDTEVFSFNALALAWREAQKKSEREHATSFIYNHPERFRMHCVKGETDLSALRLTVDEPADLDLVRSIFQRLGNREFGLKDIVALFEKSPELRGLNQGIRRNEGYAKSLREDSIEEL